MYNSFVQASLFQRVGTSAQASDVVHGPLICNGDSFGARFE